MFPTRIDDFPYGDVYAWGLAVNATGAECQSSIQQFSFPATPAYGRILTPTVQINTGTVNFPGALAIDGIGTLYVAFATSSGAGAGISEYPRGSSTPNFHLSSADEIASLAVDVAGRVYAADPAKNGIAIYNSGAASPSSFFPLAGARSVAVVPSSAFSL